MRTLAQKYKSGSHANTANKSQNTYPISGQSDEVSSILHSQRTSPDRTVQAKMKADASGANVSADTGGSQENALSRDIMTEGPAHVSGTDNGLPVPLKNSLESLSGFDLSGVRIHANSSGPSEFDALAYTQGEDIHLGPGQEKHLPHEGWHVVQQMQGRVTPTTYANGLPLNDDSRLEHETDQMGQKALRMSRENAMEVGPIQGKTAGNKNASIVQCYKKYNRNKQRLGLSLGWKHPDSNYLKVAEDGEIAIGGYKQAWATDKRLNDAEAVLKANYSQVKLEKGKKTVKGKAPKTGVGNDITLTEVNAVNRDGGGRADLTADCQTAARETLGLDKRKDKAGASVKPGGVPTLTATSGYTAPKNFAYDVFKMHFGAGLTDAEARRKYNALPASDPVAFDKDDFDKKYKINKYAVPELGQALAADSPSGWNFHFAGVLLKSSEDYITGENYPKRIIFNINLRNSQDWYFDIYGPESKSQSFHEKWADSNTISMVVDVKDTDRPLIMLKKAIKNKNGEFILQALKKAIALSIPLKTIIDHPETGFARVVFAATGTHFADVLKIIKTSYRP